MADLSKYSIGWICAIDTEYTAARAFLDETHEPPEAIPVHDHNAYTLGRVGKHNVVIAVLPDGEYGLSTAGVVAQRMLGSFPNVRVGLMVGIGGGAPSQRTGYDIRLGDVVVSSPRDGHTGVLQYDFGKTIQDQEFKVTRSLNLPPDVLRTAVTKLRVTFEEEGNNFPKAIDAALAKRPRLRRKYGRPPPETDRLFLSHVVHDPDDPIETPAPDLLVSRPERGEDDDNPVVFYGLIASANQLMKDAKVRDKYAAEKNVLCFEMEAAGLMNHFPCLVIRGICDYSDSHKNKQWQGYAAMAAAAYAKALLSIILPTKVENEKRLSEIVESGLQGVVDAVTGMSRRVDDKVLNHLPVAKGAAYDSRDDPHEDTCLPGTSVELLKNITQWAQDPNDQRIYWLKGMASTGKSTISRTFATTCAGRNILGASFFFKRGESDRSNAGLFFSTIARQLVDRREDLYQPMIDAIKEDQDVSSKRMSEQCRILLEEPLQKAQLQLHDPPQVIIIDALDECADDRDVKSLVVLLSKLSERKSFGLKIFITSRPDVAAEFAFGSIDGFYQEIILQEVEKDIIDNDIGTYLDVTLSSIRDQWNCSTQGKDSRILDDWPKREVLGILVEHARPLLIFAATVCRFVQDYRRGNPQEQLGYLLQAIEDQEVGGTMYATYFPILQNFMKGVAGFKRQDFGHLQSFRHIVGTIILLEEPMCAESLSQLIKVKANDVRLITNLLKSVFDVSKGREQAIKLFHLSFRDFLISSEAGEFMINSKDAHAKIALNCIQLLSSRRSLRYNMGTLQPGDHYSKLDRQVVDREFPPHMRYACVHFVRHLKESEARLRDGDSIHQFLQVYLLHWTEALVILGKASTIVSILDNLIGLVEVSVHQGLIQLLQDFKFFILRHISIFANYPLQLYWSAIPFCPSESATRKTFANSVPPVIDFVTGLGSRWPPLRVLDANEFNARNLGSVAVSPDSRLLACGDQCGAVLIWSLPTGQMMHTLSLPCKSWIASLVFSSNSEQLVVASMTRFYVYNTATGVLGLTFGDMGFTTNHIDASPAPGSDTFASAHNLQGKVGIWSMSTNKPPHWLNVPCNETRNLLPVYRARHLKYLIAAVGYSRDSKLIAGYFSDFGATGATYVWSVEGGHYLHRFESTAAGYASAVFSSASMIPTIMRADDMVEVFEITQDDDTADPLSITIKRCEYTVPQTRGSQGGQIAISHDHHFAAFRSDNTMMVWTLPDARMLKRIKLSALADASWESIQYRAQPDMMFSSDGQFLILVGRTSVAIWSMLAIDETEAVTPGTNPVYEETLQPHGSTAESIIACNEFFVATQMTTDSGTARVQVWSSINGQSVQSLQTLGSYDLSTKAYFSPNNHYLSIPNSKGFHQVLSIDSGNSFTMNDDLPLSSITRRKFPRCSDERAFSLSLTSISACGPHGIVLHELSTGQRVWHDSLGEAPTTLSQDGETLMYCATAPSSDTELIVVRYSKTENRRTEIHKFRDQEHVFDFSPDLLWTLFESDPDGLDRALQLRRNDGKHHFRLRTATGVISAVFSSDSSLLAEGSLDRWNQGNQVNIWSLHPRPILTRTVTILSGGHGPISFSRNNKFLDIGYRRFCIESAPGIGGDDRSISTEGPTPEWHGFFFDQSGKWIVYEGRKMILIPKQWKCKLRHEDLYSRVGDKYIAWITPTHEFFMMRFT